MVEGKSERGPVTPSIRFRRILVAVDGSENSERAAGVAIDMAEKYGSELVVLHVVPRVSHSFVPVQSSVLFREYYSDMEKAAMKYIDKTISRAKSMDVDAKAVVLVAAPSVGEKIVNHADRKNIDLIVIGTRGREGFKRLLMGSVSSGVVAHAHCPVLVIR